MVTLITRRHLALDLLTMYFMLRLDGDGQAQADQRDQVDAWRGDINAFPLVAEKADEYYTMILSDDGYSSDFRVQFDAEGTPVFATFKPDDNFMPLVIYSAGEFHAKD